MAKMVMMALYVVVTCMVLVAPYAKAAVTCATVVDNLRPCVSYLTNGGTTTVPPECCSGIVQLDKLAVSEADRQAACNCIKEAASSVRGITLGLAAGLPDMCDVDLPFEISPNTDCTTVQ